ncbi:phosphoprotein associated with glycosphingolipid-enriched microdomains 1-like [Salvelinus fontinalis]|uniref:phosphoprotein associated with glycosphingolipid-enriched microdomains 1-like n=1 Tax=Salvelinus fontinalis TaxID=8038 RepID=UPI002485F62C|nr:phosphoprotein associated with glycosphingolipid-enriched microdomains 1-like [Salvelinus fontinalis]XP_055749490.1 phosphoprotein associated with glycosphingolipid-enriched microdomains 1-like [Salvelinus fontinalis]XP_055749491.1 phosphoprotein associated with glycosphingolipid-enriched microdomains 1-like [Salvelinus fontinalis]XP_055749492.1 phosphoprotein associated with glycosphingolipid-enriched microdomains 1-like [Salvelinus fontinalis]XP_055749493.1 phosphoprotein associated with g
MAPVLSALWKLGVLGSGDAMATSLGNEQLVLVGTLMTISVFLLLSLLLLLCAGCQGPKTSNGRPVAHESLMNGVSERETFTGSQSVDSPGTDLLVSSSHNGPLTSGTVLTDTQDSSPQPSEEMLSSQSELRSSKCPQDRELPSIPPNSALNGMGSSSGPLLPPSGDGTYEVVKERGGDLTASRDVSVEDSLYETVKELKDHPGSMAAGLPNGHGTTSPLSPDDNEISHNHLPPPNNPPALHNGQLSPGTPERGPLCAGVEYASVNLNKKSRYSAELETRRSATIAAAVNPTEEPEEEDRPPPVPDKMLDENDNQPTMMDAGAVVVLGAALQNGQLDFPLSTSPWRDNPVVSESELSDMYSMVGKPGLDVEEKESDYSSIADIKGLVSEYSSSDLYATVSDIYPQPREGESDPQGPPTESTEPGYEIIHIPKTDSGEDLGLGNQVQEPDYESVGELALGLNRESSRL